MEMLPSLARITVAILGFVAILVLHESLVSTTGATQVVSSADTVSAPSAIDRSDAVDVAVNHAPDVYSTPEIAVQGNDTSDSGAGTTQVSDTDLMDAGAESTSESTAEQQDTMRDELRDTVTGEQEDSEQARSSESEDAAVPAAFSTSPTTADSLTRQWSAVWRPFFSPATAQGFADYISESTGLTLRVQPAQIAGHYLVEVQHGTEAERIDADRRIVEYTGFKPPGAVQ